MVMWSLIPPEKGEEPRIRLRVSEIMNRNLITVTPEDTVFKAAKLMSEHNIGSVVVMKGGELKGIVTERDLISRYIAKKDGRRPEDVKVREVMTDKPVTIRDNVDIDEAARLMVDRNVRRLIVVNSDGKVVGIVSSRDILKVAPHIWFILSEKLRLAKSKRGWSLV
ncbi:MAG: CBS domain-containing protein [Thermoproteota archaeon]|nr:MAG: CBS domain-containing protein [Candidatus Korarchaeota archaeon]